jgi:hypothetical protein
MDVSPALQRGESCKQKGIESRRDGARPCWPICIVPTGLNLSFSVHPALKRGANQLCASGACIKSVQYASSTLTSSKMRT